MTVCVATQANNGTLFFAADRLLTRGIVQSEPTTPKIYNFPGPPFPVTLMWAGASTVFAEVIQVALTAIKANPDKFRSIQDCVECYCDCYAAFLGKRAERAILSRLGLTRQTLVSSKVSNDRAAYLVDQVTTFGLPEDHDVSVIIAGHDDSGAHIWSVHNDTPSCHDVEGFAAVGIGADHADSALRFSGFTHQWEGSRAMMMAYFAKRRAEVAPGVGRATDLQMRGADRRNFIVEPELLGKLCKSDTCRWM